MIGYYNLNQSMSKCLLSSHYLEKSSNPLYIEDENNGKIGGGSQSGGRYRKSQYTEGMNLNPIKYRVQEHMVMDLYLLVLEHMEQEIIILVIDKQLFGIKL